MTISSSTTFNTRPSIWSGLVSLNEIDLSTILKANDISYPVQEHLICIYLLLTCVLLTASLAAFGSLWLNSSTWFSVLNSGYFGLFIFLASIGGIIYLQNTASRSCVMETPLQYKRYAVLFTVSAIIGFNLSNIVGIAIDIDPSNVVTALLLTTCTFMCFSLSACLATRRSYLYLGGIFGTLFFGTLIIAIGNTYFQSYMLQSIQLYLGLFIYCGYVVFDTQIIIEKASSGDYDTILHTLNLFLDIIAIFVRILIILTENSKDKRSNQQCAARVK